MIVIKGGRTAPDITKSVAHAHYQSRNAGLLESFANAMRTAEEYSTNVLAQLRKEDEEAKSNPDADVNPFLVHRNELEKMTAVRTAFNMSMSTPRQGPCTHRYHSLDGGCQNSAGFGKVFDTYSRIVPHAYCNGRDSRRCRRDGRPLPHPRVVSLTLQSLRRTVDFNFAVSRLTADFGQFVTHDMLQTPDLAAGGPSPCNCRADTDQWCIQMKMPPNEPVITRLPCFFIVKSSGRILNGPRGIVVEQYNQQTTFMDLGNVYGNNANMNDKLRDRFDRSKLMLKDKGHRKGLYLPNLHDPEFNRDAWVQKFYKLDPFLNENHRTQGGFVAGDTRCTENPMLTSFGTMFARFHNIAAEEVNSNSSTI